MARTLEQDLIWALISWLASGEVQTNGAARHLQTSILVRFSGAGVSVLPVILICTAVVYWVFHGNCG